MKPEHAIYALWAAWLVSWTVAMFWSNRTEKRDAIASELLFRVFFYTGLVLLLAFPSSRQSDAQTQLWQFGDATNSILVALTGAGLLFTWWACIHLGPLWSDWVVKKAGHHLVDTGPYRLVRHPIYSGLIFTASVTALQRGTALALLGVVAITLAFYAKARREERFLHAQLGADAANAYDNYARKTPMLVPFVRKQQARRVIPHGPMPEHPNDGPRMPKWPLVISNGSFQLRLFR